MSTQGSLTTTNYYAQRFMENLSKAYGYGRALGLSDGDIRAVIDTRHEASKLRPGAMSWADVHGDIAALAQTRTPGGNA